MARPREQGINTVAQSLRQLRRFCHLINADKVFGTHSAYLVVGLVPNGDLSHACDMAVSTLGREPRVRLQSYSRYPDSIETLRTYRLMSMSFVLED